MRVYLNQQEIESLRGWNECPESLKAKVKLSECFLVEEFDTSKATSKYVVYDNPQKTNQSHEIRIKGWLGTTNNINHTALGKFASTSDAINSLDVKVEEASEDYYLATYYGDPDHPRVFFPV